MENIEDEHIAFEDAVDKVFEEKDLFLNTREIAASIPFEYRLTNFANWRQSL